MVDSKSDEVVGDSVTAGDGSYYIGEVKPGRFVLKVDTKTLPGEYGLIETQRDVTVTAKKEFSELTLKPFIAKRFPSVELKRLGGASNPAPTSLEALLDGYLSRSDWLGI